MDLAVWFSRMQNRMQDQMFIENFIRLINSHLSFSLYFLGITYHHLKLPRKHTKSLTKSS